MGARDCSATCGVEVELVLGGCIDGDECFVVLEGDSGTVYSVVRELLDCMYQLHGACSRFSVNSTLWVVTGRDVGEKRYNVDIHVDPRCGLGVILCWSLDDASLAMLVDPLRGEGLVEVDKGLYLDHRLAECLSRGGRCGEIRVKRYRGKNRWMYKIRVCDFINFYALGPEENRVDILRVIEANKLSPGIVVDAARRLGASLQELRVIAECVYNYDIPEHMAVDIRVSPVDGPGRLHAEVDISVKLVRASSRGLQLLLRSLLCLARVLSRASRVQNRNARL